VTYTPRGTFKRKRARAHAVYTHIQRVYEVHAAAIMNKFALCIPEIVCVCRPENGMSLFFVHLILFYFYYYFFPFPPRPSAAASRFSPRPHLGSLFFPSLTTRPPADIGLSQELGAHQPAAVFDRSQKQRQQRSRLRLRLLDRSSFRRTKHTIITIIIFFVVVVPLAVLRTLYIMCTSPPAPQPRPRPKKELNVFPLM